MPFRSRWCSRDPYLTLCVISPGKIYVAITYEGAQAVFPVFSVSDMFLPNEPNLGYRLLMNGQVDVHSRGRCYGHTGAGGLQSLKFVEVPEKRPLKAVLVASHLLEGIRF